MKINGIRVCYFGTYRPHYERNRINIDRLRSQGIEVIECHSQLWTGDQDRQDILMGGWMSLSFWKRVFKTYFDLLRNFITIGNFDIMIVGYPGQFDIFLARLLTWIRGKSLVWDFLMSLYLIAQERNVPTKNCFIIKFLYKLEKIGVKLPDLLIIDTPEYSQWLQDQYGINPKKIKLLPLGADDHEFKPIDRKQGLKKTCLTILYYGSFIPNHGMMYIIEAAKILKNDNKIRFELIGDGPQKQDVINYVKEYHLENVTLVDWLEKKDLINKISLADVLLGTFGNTPQSMMTIQNKIWEGLAMAKPIINGDSATIRNVLVHSTHIYLCERENSKAIADSIIFLANNHNLRKQMANEGLKYYRENFSTQKIAQLLQEHLLELAKK